MKKRTVGLMAPGFLPVLNIRKRTMVEVVEEDKGITLHLAIHHAEDIDRETKDPAGDERLYCIYLWVDPNDGFWTRVAEGLPNPRWNTRYSIPLGKSPEYSYLYLEIYRIGSNSDPGTSNGDVLVGRTRIPLPEGINRKKGGRFGLVVPKGTGCIPEGHIILAMEMRHQEY